MDYNELAKQFIEDGAWGGVPAIVVKLFAQWLEEHEALQNKERLQRKKIFRKIN